jgi:hypothetical protein
MSDPGTHRPEINSSLSEGKKELKVRLCKKINNYVNAELCLKFNY